MNVILALFGKTLSPLWSAVAEVIAVAVAVLLAWWAFAGHYERAGAAKVQATIDAPVTGWRARLSQCDANGVTLNAALKDAAASLTALKAQGDADTASAEKAASDARRAAAGYQKQSAYIAAHHPVGTDACSKLADIDSVVLGSLH